MYRNYGLKDGRYIPLYILVAFRSVCTRAQHIWWALHGVFGFARGIFWGIAAKELVGLTVFLGARWTLCLFTLFNQ